MTDDKKIRIIIDKHTLEKYNKLYFKLHPRAVKEPIEVPFHPSINTWMIMKRPAMNRLKGIWKDFIVWLMKDLGLTGYGIDQCDMKFTMYFPTKARHDPDNNSPKFLMDGLTESGFIIDDDGKHIKSLTLVCEYDKEYPRTEIEITNIELKEN